MQSGASESVEQFAFSICNNKHATNNNDKKNNNRTKCEMRPNEAIINYQ